MENDHYKEGDLVRIDDPDEAWAAQICYIAEIMKSHPRWQQIMRDYPNIRREVGEAQLARVGKPLLIPACEKEERNNDGR